MSRSAFLTYLLLYLSQRRTFQPEAFDLLVGAWRPDSPKAADAIRSWKMHIWGAVRPNMKAFMIGIFGMEAVTGMLRMDDEDSK